MMATWQWGSVTQPADSLFAVIHLFRHVKSFFYLFSHLDFYPSLNALMEHDDESNQALWQNPIQHTGDSLIKQSVSEAFMKACKRQMWRREPKLVTEMLRPQKPPWEKHCNQKEAAVCWRVQTVSQTATGNALLTVYCRDAALKL